MRLYFYECSLNDEYFDYLITLRISERLVIYYL